MSTTTSLSAGRLAELLVSAAGHLSGECSSAAQLTPLGVPVRRGRLHLGRLHRRLARHEPVTAVAGFATAVWLGPARAAPSWSGLAFRAETWVDGRGRVLLDRRLRSWLAVEDPMDFDVVVVPDVGDAGLWVVPVEEFARRWKALSP